MDQILLKPETKTFNVGAGTGDKNFDAWSWSPRFEFRLHSLG